MAISGRYILSKKITQGGMAELFLGKALGEDSFERLCCFKRILPDFAKDPSFVAMFRDEAHIGKRLQHSNIVRVEGFEEVEGGYAIVMEFVSGADLKAIITEASQRGQAIPIPIALYVIAEAARGLHYAHTRLDDATQRPLNLVHRDISPQNILISFEGEVKVTDFGIAHTEDKEGQTKTGIVKGKFAYMSPEQIRSDPTDARTDVFALSIVLWELLTGRRLFQAENEAMTIQAVREALIPGNLNIYNEQVTDTLEALVMKGLEKEPENRYQSAAEFESALRSHLSNFYPEFMSNRLGEFVSQIMSERREMLTNLIREIMSAKSSRPSKVENDRTVVQPVASSLPSSTAPSATSGGRPLPKAASSASMRRTVSPTPMPMTHKKTSSFSFAPFLFLIVVGGVLGGAWFLYHKYVLSVPPDWEIVIVPERVRMTLNDTPLENGQYIDTPYFLHNVPAGDYTLKIQRPGFNDETIHESVSLGSKKLVSKKVLAAQGQMAPLKVQIVGASEPVTVTIDDGFFLQEFLPETIYNIDHISFGVTHTLKLRLKNNTSFECSFVPRATNWQEAFFVRADGSRSSCSYPAL